MPRRQKAISLSSNLGSTRVQNFTSATRAAASDANLTRREHELEITHSTGGLHLHGGRRVRAHQPQIIERCTGRSEASRGFHPVDTELAADFAQSDLLRIVQIAILEDHF